MTDSNDSMLPRYDIQRTYRWNYEHPPDPVDVPIPTVQGPSSFAGLPAKSPLGIAAGPLLNGRWALYYASLGFDVLTYKTVRSGARECYPLPNLVHVPDVDQTLSDGDAVATEAATGSWAVSFGMPSSPPDQWRVDVASTRKKLAADKLLNVSVVGTVQPGWTIHELAADYARCARWAVESGGDTIEANLSCPNVSTCDGQLYQRCDDARIVAESIRDAIGDVPLILKIGHVIDPSHASLFLDSVKDFATAIAMTNSVAGRVKGTDDAMLFQGERRGICGRATFAASCQQVAMFSRLIKERDAGLRIIGVGGASTAEDIKSYLSAGAECVHLATAAMLDPGVARTIKSGL